MKHSTKTPTTTEQARLDAIHEMECIACQMEAEFARNRNEIVLGQPFPTEAHHLTDKGYRIHSGGHMSTIPLEAWHHRGICLDGLTATDMTKLYGPSIARNKRAFTALYGTERELLAIIDARLKERDAA